jgi:hypothetical protein
MKFTLRKFPLLVAAFFCAGRLAYAQAVDTIVEIPTTSHRSALIEIPTAQTASQSNLDNNVTMAGEYKSTKNVIEEQKPVCWNWYADFGYTSEYNFRGTNLTPGSDGAVFANLAVSRWGFTLGLYDVYQLGTARFPSFSAGEGGGGGTIGSDPAVGTFSPETVQTFFNEIDLFLQYRHDVGPLEITVGNIGFFIHRDAQTFLTTQFFNQFFGPSNPFPTVQNEQFDRVFLRLATSVIPHIQPWITYYQTIHNDGEDHRHYMDPSGSTFGNPFNDNFHERNDRLGGYLEGRIRGNFSVGEWIDFNPFAVISYSIHDRTEPIVSASQTSDHVIQFADTIRGRSLVGWNVAQAGLELPIHLFHVLGSSSGPCAPPDLHVDFVPGFTYSYHISRPTGGTDRDEIFGGAKIALTF